VDTDPIFARADGSIVEARQPTPPRALRARGRLNAREIGVMTLASLGLLLASVLDPRHAPLTEILGFVTGGVCVWLVVRENVWNWPIGLANNVFFLVLFLHGRLFADMALQVVYLLLGVYGWLNWLFGADGRDGLTISRTTRGEWIAILGLVPLATWGLWLVLVEVHDAAPSADALTTVLSLAAQYLLCRKRLENWVFWIAADLVYVPLYLSRDLVFTAVLYAVFLVMCLVGVREWRATWCASRLVDGGP
jgi:nicotinamide mononucleotide transporter